MIDDFAKEYLHENLRWARESLLSKLDGVAEYDLRRPLTVTGTNLLGLVRHLTLSEARYFGGVFNRPYPQAIPTFDDPGYDNRDYMWVPADVSRGEVLADYARACQHADDTIAALPIDAAGHVPWWPRPNVKLLNILVHLSCETNRHAGHADVMREQIDGALGDDPSPMSSADAEEWARHFATVEAAAVAASTSMGHQK